MDSLVKSIKCNSKVWVCQEEREHPLNIINQDLAENNDEYTLNSFVN